MRTISFILTFLLGIMIQARLVLEMARINHTLGIVTGDLISTSERFSLLQHFIELEIRPPIQKKNQSLKLGLDTTTDISRLYLSKIRSNKLSQNKTLKRDLALTNDYILSDYEFLLESKSQHEGIYQGTLGLGLGKNGSSNPKNFISLLLYNNIIDNGIFAFNYVDGNSSVVFGGYEPKFAKEFKYYSVEDSWTIKIDACKFEYKTVDCQGTKQVEFDSSIFGIVLPKKLAMSFLNSFKNRLTHPDDCQYVPNLYLKCECNILFSMFMIDFISINLGGTEYFISLKDLFLREELSGKTLLNDAICYYGITYSTKKGAEKKMLLGQSFLSKYYVLFDFENRKLGISEIDPSYISSRINNPFSEDVLLSLGILGFFFITISLFYFMYKLLKSENMRKSNFSKVSTTESS